MANSKDVVVTGVSTGIGWGTTKVLIGKGFRVFGSVRKQADADRLQKEFGSVFVPLLMDITDADAVQQAALKVSSMVGDRNLVGLVNNAGIVVSGPLLYLRPSEYRRQLDVNMIAPMVVIQAFAPLLGTDSNRQGPAGRIVNISSSGAKVAIPLLGAYSASKFGLEGMSDALRRELMLFGIDVVIIEPGTVNTAMLGIPAKEIVHSDLISIIYRAQRSRQFYVERFIDISQEKSLGVVVSCGRRADTISCCRLTRVTVARTH